MNRLWSSVQRKLLLQRLRERDGEDNVNEDVVLNGATENQLRPLIDTMKVFNTSIPLEETLSEVDIYIKSLERKISKNN